MSMNLLCPDCHSSISVETSDPWLRCDSCGLKASLSRVETAPGTASFPLVPDLTGETLGGYVLGELVGVGGMGVVYKAQPSEAPDADPVAVKVLNCDYHWQREEFVSRFQREARALERLDHPNIVKILDSGQADERYYLVTEYVDGPNLAQVLRSRELSVREVVALLGQVCEAITYAHAQGVVHRDIKPANVVLDGERALVLDFGLAQITGGNTGLSSLTRTDLAMGTINYLSPEQRTSAKQVDERSDVFSLGVVLYEMLTGNLPLGGFEQASRSRPELGRRGDRVVSRALQARPAQRYQTVAELADDLKLLVARRRVGAWVGVAALVLAAVGLGIGIWKLGLGMGDAPDTSAAPHAAAPSADAQVVSVLADASPAVRAVTSRQADAAIKPSVKTPGVAVFVEGDTGRRYPYRNGRGLYSMRKGQWPVAIIDHLGQRWPLRKGWSLKSVLSRFGRGKVVKKRIYGGKKPPPSTGAVKDGRRKTKKRPPKGRPRPLLRPMMPIK